MSDEPAITVPAMVEGSIGRVFDDIYRHNTWNGGESRSGPGSSFAAAWSATQALQLVVDYIGARSVLHVGCGDDLWTPDLPGYVGVDVSVAAIELANRNHGDRQYRVLDARSVDELGPFDLVLVRDTFQHLPLAHTLAILDAIRAGGSTWLLASTYLGTENTELEVGGFGTTNLLAPPFDLPRPHVLMFDGWGYEAGSTVARDPRKFLGLWFVDDQLPPVDPDWQEDNHG